MKKVFRNVKNIRVIQLDNDALELSFETPLEIDGVSYNGRLTIPMDSLRFLFKDFEIELFPRPQVLF